MKTVFVTTELDPILPGGAGTVVSLLDLLLKGAGHESRVVLVTDGSLEAVPEGVQPVPPGAPDAAASTPFLARSRAAAQALSGPETGQIDLIEFQDFDGLAFWTLTHRRELGLEHVPIAIRMHGPADLMFEAIGVIPEDIRAIRVMEAESYRMADLVIAPSQALRQLLIHRYQLDPDRVKIGQPPVAEMEKVAPEPAPFPEIVYFGRLAEVKGAHDFVAAVVPILTRHPQGRARLIGPDGWSAEAGLPMQEWLEQQVPSSLKERVLFEGSVDRANLGKILRTAWMVAMPSRFESFSLAAHEVRRLGHPLILPDLPAFAGFFGEATGAVIYDGSVTGLVDAITSVLDDEALRRGLATAPPPPLSDPLEIYRDQPPPPRHSRSQSGLATAAQKRLEDALAPSAPALIGALRPLLRALPQPLAKLAVRVVPQRLKDQIRPVANWRIEAARRQQQSRREKVERRIARGDFPEISDPLVTVVIPCYNQGRFLDDAITSIFEQTFPYFEIVVVDDGSDQPATVSRLEELTWPRTRLIRQRNKGLPAARNAGISVSKAPFIVPLDADDELAPEFLAELINALDRNPKSGYAHCWAELFEDQRALYVVRPFNPYQLLLSNSVIGCVLMRRQAWEEVGGYDETMREGHEDWDLWVRMLHAGWEQTLIRKPLFRYRKHGISMSVETESRFEHGREQIIKRHPDMYQPQAIMTTKSRWYPWLSVITSPLAAERALELAPDDAELLVTGTVTPDLASRARQRGWGVREVGAAMSDAIGAVSGKFVLILDHVGPGTDPKAVQHLLVALEAEPGALGAGPVGCTRPVVWRRWPLVDRAADHRTITRVAVKMEILGSDGLAPGAFPQPGWDLQADLERVELDVPLQRQPPEEEGPVPGWLP